MQHTVIPSWYQRDGYVQAMSSLIEKELEKFKNPDDVRYQNVHVGNVGLLASR
jgi:protoheme ferro-lyase